MLDPRSIDSWRRAVFHCRLWAVYHTSILLAIASARSMRSRKMNSCEGEVAKDLTETHYGDGCVYKSEDCCASKCGRAYGRAGYWRRRNWSHQGSSPLRSIITQPFRSCRLTINHIRAWLDISTTSDLSACTPACTPARTSKLSGTQRAASKTWRGT